MSPTPVYPFRANAGTALRALFPSYKMGAFMGFGGLCGLEGLR
jgi:hypothetical protein